jgi:hypothetical protein
VELLIDAEDEVSISCDDEDDGMLQFDWVKNGMLHVETNKVLEGTLVSFKLIA